MPKRRNSLNEWLNYAAKEVVNGPKHVPQVPDTPKNISMRRRAGNPVGQYFTGHAKLLEPSDNLFNARIHPVPPASSITRSFLPEHHYTLDLPPKITSEKLRRADRSFLPEGSPLTRQHGPKTKGSVDLLGWTTGRSENRRINPEAKRAMDEAGKRWSELMKRPYSDMEYVKAKDAFLRARAKYDSHYLSDLET